MNREIKFRAFHKVNKQMEYEGWNERNGNSTYCSKTTLFMYGEDAEIMQFTGLLDKNGVDIYEGDILKSWYSRDTSGTDIIEFTQEVEHSIRGDWSGVELAFLENSEVIGNIYENAELITT